MLISIAIQLLDIMLQYAPEKRCSATEALGSQYLAPYHDSADEPTAEQKIDWSFLEAELPVDLWKTVLYSEVLRYLGESSGLKSPSTTVDSMDMT